MIEKIIIVFLNMIFVYLYVEYEDEIGFLYWFIKRFDKVIVFRENVLLVVRRVWADYLFVRKIEFMYLCNFKLNC